MSTKLINKLTGESKYASIYLDSFSFCLVFIPKNVFDLESPWLAMRFFNCISQEIVLTRIRTQTLYLSN